MIDWKDTCPGSTFRKAQLLDCSFRAYPSRNRGAYALHLHAIIGINSSLPFSIMRYTRYLEGTVVLPQAGITAKFDQMSLWDSGEFSIDGILTSAGMHLTAFTPVTRIEPELAQIELHLGIKFCHPYEDETLIRTRMPLHVCSPTGPLAPPKRPFRSDIAFLPSKTEWLSGERA